jgi:transcription elongation GreA/GreB family factor
VAVPPKRALHEQLCAALRAELDAAIRAHKTTAAGATHEAARPENDKDTRALEQSYVARGQAARVRDLATALAETERMALRAFGPDQPIALGALVAAVEDDTEIVLMLAPHGGGHRVGDVLIVTPQSPMGRALLGKHAGDECEVVIAGKRRLLAIERVE